MESKNIKIIDEHGIDRVANIICSIDVDGSDYVIYWIERDSDNDNLFISKLIKNNDGTSNMVNIEDSLEKSNLNDVVKELITYAINDDNDNIVSQVVSLKNGKNIKIADVLFNKEQNINVQKTYITTVKKSVTKVSSDYYRVDVVSKAQTNENVSEQSDSKFIPNGESLIPSLEEVGEKVVEPVIPAYSTGLETSIKTDSLQDVSVPELEQNSFRIPSESESLVSSVNEKVAEPVIPVYPTTSEVPVKPESLQDGDVHESVKSLDSQNVVPTPIPVIPEVNLEPKSQIVTPEPIMPQQTQNIDARINIIGANPTKTDEVSNLTVPGPEPATTVDNSYVKLTDDNGSKLFFDGSKESNLVEAFKDGVSNQPKIAVNNDRVESIREFGQDEPIIPLVDDVKPSVLEENKPSSSSGFANNKFFIVIAITFFLAACVFLGYEVFKYFQIG